LLKWLAYHRITFVYNGAGSQRRHRKQITAHASYAAEKLDACADAVSGGDVERAHPDLRIAKRHGRLDLASTSLSATTTLALARDAAVQLQTQPTALNDARVVDHADAQMLRGEDVNYDL